MSCLRTPLTGQHHDLQAVQRAVCIERRELTIYYDMQCPYVLQSIRTTAQYCQEAGVPLTLLPVDTLQKAKELPCVFNNYAVCYKGHFESVNLLQTAALERLLKK